MWDMGVTSSSAISPPRALGNGNGSRPLAQIVDVFFNLSDFPAVEDGERILLVGQHDALGCWNTSEGLSFEKEKFGWTTRARLRPGDHVEFKCVVSGPRGDRWEEGGNRTLTVPPAMRVPLFVNLLWEGERPVDSWDDAEDEFDATLDKLKSTLDKLQAGSREEVAPEEEAGPAAQPEQPSGVAYEEPAWEFSFDSLVTAGEGEEVLKTSGTATEAWQGKEIVFMQSNDHSGDRRGLSWDTSRLEGGSCEEEVVLGDQTAPSWREKLEVVEGILCRGSPERKDLSPEAVSACSIYLSWISSGVISCAEGGGHHRPCRHAESSMRMFRSLEWGLEEASRGEKGSFTSVLIRRLFPLLPSFSSEFRASTPLTRIRDIAHRNDIPQDLKREIKHTIQNKLHRNAGPEDLVATERMLERVMGGDGEDYSEDFVQEFKRFTVELREFFSASSLDEQLLELQAGMGDEERGRIQSFLGAKAASSQGESSLSKLLSLMDETTGLRQVLCRALASGLRNDAPERAMEMRQKYRLCEIALENFAFTVASRALNAFGGSEATRSLEEVLALALVLQKCILHLSFNGFLQAECSAISNELLACDNSIRADTSNEESVRLCMLRLKACLDRTRRVCDSYRDSYLGAYADQADRLGRAFGQAVPEHAVKMYAESETRASMVYQCAKICQNLSKNVSRDFLKSDNHEWETLVAGEAQGSLVFFETMEDHTMAQNEGSVSGDKILLLRRATGDEEVSASGDGVKGVVLMHELPHLSHLAIRARQEGVVFATCTNEEEINKLMEGLVGKYVEMDASQQKVIVSETERPKVQQVVEPATTGGPAFHETGGNGHRSLDIKKTSFLLTVGTRGSTRETCGAKAAQCGELQRMSADFPASPYKVPRGVCLPFGSMELVLDMQPRDARGQWEAKLSEMDRLLGSNSGGQELDEACKSLREMIESLDVPREFVDHSICSHFDPSGSLIARSSANVEDLKGMSGAGLYDSILNLDVNDPESVAEGVKMVWASLYTRRAVLSRHKAGIRSQSEACMAVLVQEMVASEHAFVLHTADPILSEEKERYVYAELVRGQGETLASGTQGTPYRLRIEKATGKVEILAFANFSEVDYSKDPFTQEPQRLVELGEKLCTLGEQLETQFGEPQDIEGALSEGSIYVVQSRPQE